MSFPPLDEFFDRLLMGSWYPTVRYQSSNPSPCTFGPIDSDCNVRWRPLPRRASTDDILLESSVAISTRTRTTLEQAVQFVTSYWSAPLECRYGYDRVVLDCGAWNEADLHRKSHALRDTIETVSQQNQPEVIPVAWSTVDTGVCIGLDSDSGEVVTTELGQRKGDRLAASLGDFLRGLRPVKGYFRETVRSF